MTKDWFKIITDETTGLQCVIKVVDEETKNHKSIDSEITTASGGGSRISRWGGGGAPTHWGAPTSDMYTFWQKHMQKRKKLILLGGSASGAPLDPPMARMPEMKGNRHCPVSSFESYMNHLSPKSNNLWQTPKIQ